MVPGFGEVHLVESRVQGSITKDSPGFKGSIAFLCFYGHHEFLTFGNFLKCLKCLEKIRKRLANDFPAFPCSSPFTCHISPCVLHNSIAWHSSPYPPLTLYFIPNHYRCSRQETVLSHFLKLRFISLNFTLIESKLVKQKKRYKQRRNNVGY